MAYIIKQRIYKMIGVAFLNEIVFMLIGAIVGYKAGSKLEKSKRWFKDRKW